MNFDKNFTNAQLVALDKAKNARITLICELLEYAKRLDDAIVPLPWTNERGESVVHGCNMRCHVLMEAFFSSARVLYNTLDRSEQEKLRVDWSADFSNMRFKKDLK